MQYGIDSRISCDEDPACVDVFRKQIPSCPFCRREVKGREASREYPVYLFRKWLTRVTGAQPGLHVSNRNIGVKSCQRTAKCSCRVALYKYRVWVHLIDYGFKACNDAGCRLEKCLSGQHEI